MGIAVILATALVALGPATAWAACEPSLEGLAVAERAGELRVDTVLRGSPGAGAGVARGDLVRQVNGERPTTCAAWRSVVEAAERDALDVLLLTTRGRTRRTVALEPLPPPVAPTPTPRQAAGAGPPTSIPSTRTLSTPLATVPARRRAVGGPPATRAEVIAALRALGPEARRRLGQYHEGVEHAGDVLARMLAHEPATSDADRLSRVLTLHEGARYAWEAIVRIRQSRRMRSSVPVPDAATALFFADSPVEQLCAEVEALRSFVTRWPSKNDVEVAGRWKPVPARRLLWAEADRLLAEVEGDGGQP